MGDQVIILKHEPDGMIAVGIPIIIFIFGCGPAVDNQIAARVAVKPTDNV